MIPAIAPAVKPVDPLPLLLSAVAVTVTVTVEAACRANRDALVAPRADVRVASFIWLALTSDESELSGITGAIAPR